MVRLEFDGADELIADMKKLVADYPKEASDALFEVAESFNKRRERQNAEQIWKKNKKMEGSRSKGWC